MPGYDFIHETAGVASEWSDVDGSVVSILDGSVVSILDGLAVTLNGSVVAILDQATAAALDPSTLPHAFGHGTMVAGLVHLVAPSARIMPLKAFTADGTSNVFDVVRAIYFAVDHGARVINMSFSSTAVSPELTHAINYATEHGVICVASAGNLGQETVVYPGGLRNVIGVGSTSSTAPATRSEFSNYGDALVSIGAPGEAVITTYPGAHFAARGARPSARHSPPAAPRSCCRSIRPWIRAKPPTCSVRRSRWRPRAWAEGASIFRKPWVWRQTPYRRRSPLALRPVAVRCSGAS